MKNQKKALTATLAILLCIVLAGSITVFAAYLNKVLERQNSLTIGQEEETVILGEGSDYTTPMYPGDIATFTYTVQIEGYTGTINEVQATLDETSQADFKVTVTDGEGNAFSTENPVENGDTVKVTVEMTRDANGPAPTYNSATLTVKLVESQTE